MKKETESGLSRRDFLKTAAAGTAGIAALATLGGCASADVADGGAASAGNPLADTKFHYVSDIPPADGDKSYQPRPEEIATPKIKAPVKVDYSCDVLVVGCGLAGLNAAWAASQAGKSVICVDKGFPGYSGMSAWPSCTAYYDPKRDADRETWDQYMRNSTDCFSNLDWEDVWLDESMDTFNRLKEWGWIASYPKASDTKYFVDGNMYHDDVKGYFRNVVGKNDRHLVFEKVLKQSNVTLVSQTMIVDIVESGGRCVGAVGLHYKSGSTMKFRAKAVVLCTGNGIVKSTGFPVGTDTYDGLYIGYQHGLPVSGLEVEDFHMTTSYASGNIMLNNDWQYTEQIWPIGGTVDAQHMMKRSGVSERILTYLNGFARNDTTLMDGEEKNTSCSSAFLHGDKTDPRQGKMTSPNPKGHIYGTSTGMTVHTAGGIWCGVDDTHGVTGIPGLYVAGDGTNSNYVGGPNYGAQRGSTSSFMSVQGARVGKAAADFAGTVDLAPLPSTADDIAKKVVAPLSVKTGYDPSWVRDELQNIMVPGWMQIAKTGESLSSGLTQLNILTKLVHGKMRAESGHDLRLVLEAEHLLLAMQLKLNAGIARRETRGNHYRVDYPFRDDNYLYYITQTKGSDGKPVMGKVQLKPRWIGDLSQPYTKRYPQLITPEEIAKYGSQASTKM